MKAIEQYRGLVDRCFSRLLRRCFARCTCIWPCRPYWPPWSLAHAGHVTAGACRLGGARGRSCTTWSAALVSRPPRTVDAPFLPGSPSLSFHRHDHRGHTCESVGLRDRRTSAVLQYNISITVFRQTKYCVAPMVRHDETKTTATNNYM